MSLIAAGWGQPHETGLAKILEYDVQMELLPILCNNQMSSFYFFYSKISNFKVSKIRVVRLGSVQKDVYHIKSIGYYHTNNGWRVYVKKSSWSQAIIIDQSIVTDRYCSNNCVQVVCVCVYSIHVGQPHPTSPGTRPWRNYNYLSPTSGQWMTQCTVRMHENYEYLDQWTCLSSN